MLASHSVQPRALPSIFPLRLGARREVKPGVMKEIYTLDQTRTAGLKLYLGHMVRLTWAPD